MPFGKNCLPSMLASELLIVRDAGTPVGTTPTREPGSLLLLVLGLAALSRQRLRKKPIEIR